MKNIFLFILLVLVFELKAQQNKSIGFIENKGQFTDQNGNRNNIARYLLNLNGLKVQLRSNGFSYDTYTTVRNDKSNIQDNGINVLSQLQQQEAISKFHRVDVNFLNTNPNSEIIAEGLMESNNNYFISATPETGIKNIKIYGKIIYKNIYPDIDLEFVAGTYKEKPVEYNFIVHPGANASLIKWKYEGSHDINLVNEQILIKTSNGTLAESIPLTYEKETEKSVLANYKTFNDDSFGFEIEKYNKNKTLIIDPVPFVDWCSYYGGEEDEIFNSIVTDDSGFVYVTGYTDSKTNIATVGAYQTTIHTTYDIILAKFTGSGKRIWCTYLGGDDEDFATDLTIDKWGNLYVTGNTKSVDGFSNTASFRLNFQGIRDAFISVFDKDGLWKSGTYFGGEGDDDSRKIGVDIDGNIYIAGRTNSASNITYGNIHQDTLGSKNNPDGYIAKFDNACKYLIWCSYYGGKGTDGILSFSIKDNKYVYIVGSTNSSSNIATSGTYKSINISDGQQGFFVKMDTSGKRVWGSYYGGLSSDLLSSINVDDTGNIYLLGLSESTEAIATIGSHQFQNGGQQDAFLVKIDSSFKRKWGTFFGGSGYEELARMKMNDSGDIYIVGFTNSTNQIATPGTPKPIGDPTQRDIFLAKFSNSGKQKWGTYYGTDNYYDAAFNLNIDKFGNIYIVGNTNSETNFATSGVQQPKFNGLLDAYILRLSENCDNYEIEGQKIQDMTCNSLEDGKATVKLISALPMQKYMWSNGDTTETIEALSAGWYKFIATDARGCSRQDSIEIIEPAQLMIGGMSGKVSVNKGKTEVYSIPSQANVSYRWVVINGTIQSGQGTNSITVLWGHENAGKVKALIYTYEHCGDSTEMNVSLEYGAGINRPENNIFSVYPNPANNEITVAGENINNIKIYDELGKLLVTKNPNSNNQKLYIGDISQSVILVEVTQNDGSISRHKVLILP